MNLVRYSAMMLVAGTLSAIGQIHYEPTVQHYRLHSVVQRSEERNGEKKQILVTTEQQMTMKLEGPASKRALTGQDTLRFAMTLDSVTMSANTATSLPDVTVMQGTTVSGMMLPTGKVLSFASDTKKEDGVDRKSIVEHMSQFLLTLPATASAGASWADTSRTDVSSNGIVMKGQTITKSTVLSDTTVAAQKAWRVHRSSVFTIAGTQTQENQTISMEGTGSGEAMYYIGTNGIYLGSTATETMKQTVKADGVVIPVVQIANSTVTIIP
jgi:hypothetical protein